MVNGRLTSASKPFRTSGFIHDLLQGQSSWAIFILFCLSLSSVPIHSVLATKHVR